MKGRFGTVGRCDAGSALTEMALLLPLYVAIATGMVYLANLALVKQYSTIAAGYAADAPAALSGNEMFSLLSWPSTTRVEDAGDTVKSEEMWDEQDVFSALEEVARAPVGHYVYHDGQIEYVLDEDRLSRLGEYIFDNDLQSESDRTAGVLAGWLYRSEAYLACRYVPVFGAWEGKNVPAERVYSYVQTGLSRGEHLTDESDFNTEAVDLLFGVSQFPPPLPEEPWLWLSRPYPIKQ